MILESKDINAILDKLRELEITSYRKTNADYLIGDKRVPRVTEVLSAMLHEEGLMSWANGLGYKRISYRAFMKDAADKGTYSHLAIERFLREGFVDVNKMNIMDEKIRDTVISVLDGFSQWWNELTGSHKVDIVFMEETLIHKYFGGTCDCLLKVDDQYWLIDFKTSNHMSYNYALQLAAYRFLLKELKGIDIDRAIILRMDKVNHCYYTYELDLHNDEHKIFMDNCLECFKMLVGAYMSRLYTTQQYKEIFGQSL